MHTLDFTPAEQEWVFNTAAAVLLLGNVKFKFNDKQDASMIENPDLVQKVANLLQVDYNVLLSFIFFFFFLILFVLFFLTTLSVINRNSLSP